MRPRSRHVAVQFRPATAKVLYQPLGVIGILSPWNYPAGLCLMPLATAIAAGNRAIVKPSEFTPETSALMAAMLSGVGLNLVLYAVGLAVSHEFKPYSILNLDPIIWGLGVSLVVGVWVSLSTAPPNAELVSRLFDVPPGRAHARCWPDPGRPTTCLANPFSRRQGLALVYLDPSWLTHHARA